MLNEELAQFAPIDVSSSFNGGPETLPGAQVFDQLLAQVEELIETRSPGKRFEPAELKKAAQEWLAERPRYGKWFYYPWSHRLVRVLEEPDFVELRTDRNRYKITPEEQSLLSRKKVGVVGLSVGQSVSLTLAMERSCGELRIADFDQLGLSNLNRIRTGLHHLGVKKTWITAREIAELDPYLRVRPFSEGLTPGNIDSFLLDGGKLDLLIDECDDLAVKVLMRHRARELGIPVLMETSDRGTIDIERFDLEPKRPLFHGLAGDLDVNTLRQLRSAEDKIPYALQIMGADTTSPRLLASAIEVGVTIKTWPQLASAVIYGGGIAGDTVRRIFLGQVQASGRFFVDPEQIIRDDQPANLLKAPIPVPGPGSQPNPLRNRPSEPGGESKPASERLRILEKLVRAGTSALSGGNVQPWKWIFKSSVLELHLDVQRANGLIDFEQTASLVALGAAVEALRITAEAEGIQVRITKFPDGISGTRIATFESDWIPRESARKGDSLAEQVHLRVTNRKLGKRVPLPEGCSERLRQSATAIPGAQLRLLTRESELKEIAAILGKVDRLRFFSQELHREMISELRWTGEEASRTADGIDIQTLELSPAAIAGIQLCRSWPAMKHLESIGGGRALERSAHVSIGSSSAVGLLTMPSMDRAAYLDGGMALERVWLAATAEKLAIQPWSVFPFLYARSRKNAAHFFSPEQVRALQSLRPAYEKLFQLDGNEGEVLLFRISVADACSARSLRRPLAEVLQIEEA